MQNSSEPIRTVALVQSRDAASNLTIYRIGGMDCRAEVTGAGSPVTPREETSFSAAVVVPHGVAAADETGRLTLYRQNLVGPHDQSVEMPGLSEADTSIWAGAPVSVLSWPTPGLLVSGDGAGRLMGWRCDDPTAPPRLIAMANAAWLSILSMDDQHLIALASDGVWVVIDDLGHPLSDGVLPLTESTITRVQWCRDFGLLLYQTASPENAPDSPDALQPSLVHQEWCAWNMAARQPVPLPQALRFTQTLVATPHHVLAMNTQGQSFLWPPPPEKLSPPPKALDPSAYQSSMPLDDVDNSNRLAASPQALTGWPAGPAHAILLVDDTPILLHIDPFGTAQGLRLRGDMWHPHRLPIPTSGVHRAWMTRPGAVERAAALHHEKLLNRLTDEALQAHQEQRHDDRNHLLDQLGHMTSPSHCSQLDSAPGDPLPGAGVGAIKAMTLRARFLAEDGDLFSALKLIRRVVLAEGWDASSTLLHYYGRLLWRSGAINELTSYRHTDWPAIYDGLHLDADPDRLLRHIGILVDTYSPCPPSDCPWHDLAWACVKQQGTVSPYWLGGEPLTPVALLPGDEALLKRVMLGCGAEMTSLSVMTSQGSLRPAAGWAWSDPIAGTPMYRQLLAWRLNTDARTLHVRWAVSAECFASAEDWSIAWEALQDSAWRATSRRLIEIVRESIACEVAPEPAIVQAASITPLPPGPMTYHRDVAVETEVHR